MPLGGYRGTEFRYIHVYLSQIVVVVIIIIIMINHAEIRVTLSH